MLLHATLLVWGYRPGEGRDLRPVASAALAAKLVALRAGESRTDARSDAGTRDADGGKTKTPRPGGAGAVSRQVGDSANSTNRMPELDGGESLDPSTRDALSDYLLALAAAARQSPDRRAAPAFPASAGVVGLALSLRAGRPAIRLTASSGQPGLDRAVLQLLQVAVHRVPVPEVFVVRSLSVDIPVEWSPSE